MIWSKPLSRKCSRIDSSTGLPNRGIIGFGTTLVIGRTRVPFPAARTIAFISLLPAHFQREQRNVVFEFPFAAPLFDLGFQTAQHFAQRFGSCARQILA